MKNLLLIFVFIVLGSCSPKLKQSFSKLSKPERTWVVFHAFKAKRAYQISLEAERVKDSLKVATIIGTDNNGGKLDAFKHSYWMARLTQSIGKQSAYSLGKAHEKGNYQTYKKRKLEDGMLPDKPATDMDLFNNHVGIRIGMQKNIRSKNMLIQTVLDSVNEGNMRVLLKNNLGDFLDCQEKRIPLDSLKHKWNTKKCLVPSNVRSF
jgi:hypothetical protein